MTHRSNEFRSGPLLALREILDVTRSAIQAFSYHRTQRMAAALAYYTFFSLFPLLLLLLAGIGFLLDAGWPIAVDVREYLLQALATTLPAASEMVQSVLKSIEVTRGTSGLIGLLGLLWSASSTFNQLHCTLDEIWGLNEIPDFPLTVRRRVASIGIVLSLGMLLLGAQALKSVTYWITRFTDQVPGGASIFGGLTWFFPILVSTIAFGVIFRIFPSKSVSWRDVWPGAVLAGVGWELLKWLFVVYTSSFGDWLAVYGSVAWVIGLLTWLYLSFIVILFGAEFSAAYSVQVKYPVIKESGSMISEGLDRPSQEEPFSPAFEPPVASIAQAARSDDRRIWRPSFLSGTMAGLLGFLAALSIGVGLLVNSARRSGKAPLE